MKQNQQGNVSEAGFPYQLLSRLQQDCDYYLGAGNRSKKHLWALGEAAQIEKMRKLYDELPEKPEWLSLEQIEQYATQMLRDPELESSNQRNVVDRHLAVDGTDECGLFAGDGEQPPFVVFDIDAQENIAGPFVTRNDGERARVDILEGAEPMLNAVLLKALCEIIDGEKPVMDDLVRLEVDIRAELIRE